VPDPDPETPDPETPDAGAPDAETESELAAEWGERARAEPRWPASVAVAIAIGLQVVLPHRHGARPALGAPEPRGRARGGRCS
jgi:hypothetical protein